MTLLRNITRCSSRGSLCSIRAPFSTGRFLLSGKEDALHTEDRASKVEQLKKEGINNKEWKEGLASNSESIVKAEREKVQSTKKHIEDLQKQTEKILNKGS